MSNRQKGNCRADNFGACPFGAGWHRDPTGCRNPAGAGEIAIKVTGLRSAKGVVRACLTSRPANFPRSCDDPSSLRAVAQAGEQVEFRFAGAQSGRYAVALLHDANGNGKTDRDGAQP